MTTEQAVRDQLIQMRDLRFHYRDRVILRGLSHIGTV